MIKQIIYSHYAFEKDASTKQELNYKVYSELVGKAEVRHIGGSGVEKRYTVISNDKYLSVEELALLCDDINLLCYGYSYKDGEILIYTNRDKREGLR